MLLYRFLDVHQDDLAELAGKAEELAEILVGQPPISEHLRLLARVDIEQLPGEAMTGRREWSFPA